MNNRNKELWKILVGIAKATGQALLTALLSIGLLALGVLRIAAELLAAIARLITLLLPGLLKASIVAAVLGSTLFALPVIFVAYQISPDDMLALIPAVAVVLLPTLAALAAGAGWPGLLLASVATLAAGWIVSVSTPLLLSLYVAASIIGLHIIHFTTPSSDDDEEPIGATNHETKDDEINHVEYRPDWLEDRLAALHS